MGSLDSLFKEVMVIKDRNRSMFKTNFPTTLESHDDPELPDSRLRIANSMPLNNGRWTHFNQNSMDLIFSSSSGFALSPPPARKHNVT